MQNNNQKEILANMKTTTCLITTLIFSLFIFAVLLNSDGMGCEKCAAGSVKTNKYKEALLRFGEDNNNRLFKHSLTSQEEGRQTTSCMYFVLRSGVIYEVMRGTLEEVPTHYNVDDLFPLERLGEYLPATSQSSILSTRDMILWGKESPWY